MLQRFLDTGSLSLFDITSSSIRPNAKDKKSNKIIAKCIGLLPHARDEQFVDDLTNTAVGDVIYKVIVGLSEIENLEDSVNSERRMEDVDLYLDTPLILSLLGWHGSEDQQRAAELAEMARSTGCRLKCWNHTADEVAIALEAVANRLSRTGKAENEIGEHAAEAGISAGDIFGRSVAIESDITELGVEITMPRPLELELPLDESELERIVKVEVKQLDPETRAKDVRSLSATFRARSGQPKLYLEKCEALFVTSNKAVARAAHVYFQPIFRKAGQRNVVQVCMTDLVLATRLWLKLPTRLTRLPKSQIIGHALSNLIIAPEIRERYEDYIRKVLQEGRVKGEKVTRLLVGRWASRMLALEHESAGGVGESETFQHIVRLAQEAQDRDNDERARASKGEREEVERYYKGRLSEREAELAAVIARDDPDAAAVIRKRLEEENRARNERIAMYAVSRFGSYLLARILVAMTLTVLFTGSVLGVLYGLMPNWIINEHTKEYQPWIFVMIVVANLAVVTMGIYGGHKYNLLGSIEVWLLPRLEKVFAPLGKVAAEYFRRISKESGPDDGAEK